MTKQVLFFLLILVFSAFSAKAQEDGPNNELIKKDRSCIENYAYAYGTCSANYRQYLTDDMAKRFQEGAAMENLEDWGDALDEEDPALLDQVDEAFGGFVEYIQGEEGEKCLLDKMADFLPECEFISDFEGEKATATEKGVLEELKKKPRYYLAILYWRNFLD